MKFIQKNTLKGAFGLVKSPFGLGFVPVRGFSSSNNEQIAELYKTVVTDSFPAMEKLFKNFHITVRNSSLEVLFPLYSHWVSTHAEEIAQENFDQSEVEEEVLNYIRYLKKNFKDFKLANLLPLIELLGIFRNSHFRSRLFINLVKFIESPEFSTFVLELLADPKIAVRENYKDLLYSFSICAECGIKYDITDAFLAAIKKIPIDKELATIFIKNPFLFKIRRTYWRKNFWEVVNKQREYQQALMNNSETPLDTEDINYVVKFSSFYNRVGGMHEHEMLDSILNFAVQNLEQIEDKNIRHFLQIFFTFSESQNEVTRKSRRDIFYKLLDHYMSNATGNDKLYGYVIELMARNRISKYKDAIELLKTQIDDCHNVNNVRYLMHHLKYTYPYLWADANKKTEDKLEHAYQKFVDKLKAQSEEEKNTDREFQESDLSPLLEAIGIEFTKNISEGLISFSYEFKNFQQWIENNSSNEDLKTSVAEFLSAAPNTLVGIQIHSSRHTDYHTRHFNSLFYFIKGLRVGLERPVIGLDIKQSQFRYLLKSENPDKDLTSMLLQTTESWLRQTRKDEQRKSSRMEAKRNRREAQNNQEEATQAQE